jgi:hypothetical protein
VPDFPGKDTRPHQQCRGPCQTELPLDEEHWDRDASRASGFRAYCKGCRAEARKLKRQMTVDQRVQLLDKAAMREIGRMANGGTDIPHAAELFQAIVRLMGGVQGVSKHYVSNMLSAPAGSQTRERMLTQVVKLGQFVTQEGAADTPPELMSDEDLKRELEKREVRLKYIEAEIDPVSVKELPPDAKAG